MGATAIVFISLVDASAGFATHLVSGMDTFFGLLYFAIYLLVTTYAERSPSITSFLIAGVIGGLAYGCRPDLVIFTVAVPLFSCLFDVNAERRRMAGSMLAATVTTVAAQMIGAAWYFGSPVPLSFYAKALRLYPGLRTFRFMNEYQLFDFIRAYRVLFVVIAADIMSGPRRWWRACGSVEKALALATVAYLAYLLFGVVQMMPAFQRFYYPSLPAIALLAARSVARFVERMPSVWKVAIAKISPGLRACAYASVCLYILPDLEQAKRSSFVLTGNIANFDITNEYREDWSKYWVALDQFSKLPSDFVFATTETGHVGAMNTDKVVVDLAGLNNTLFAKKTFSASLLFQRYSPDLIYMPPESFVGMNAELQNNKTFRDSYEWIPAASAQADMGIALRRSSKYYSSMQQILERRVKDGVPSR